MYFSFVCPLERRLSRLAMGFAFFRWLFVMREQDEWESSDRCELIEKILKKTCKDSIFKSHTHKRRSLLSIRMRRFIRLYEEALSLSIVNW